MDVTDDGDSYGYGDQNENHKIWTGSQDQLNGINHQNGIENDYDIYSNGIGPNSTLGRPVRQRQLAAPISVPPPPKEELRKKKDHKKSSRSPGTQSLSGTLIRPRPIHATNRPPQHMGHMMYGPPPPHMGGHGPHGPMGVLPPPPPMGSRFHTIGHRGGAPPQMMHPMHMPISMMVPPQYATLQARTGKRNKNKDKMNMNGMPVQCPIPMPPMFYPPQQVMEKSPRSLAMSSRKLAQSTAALDDSGNSGAESPSGTGIYKRKGNGFF